MARIWRRKSALSLPMFIAQSSTIPGIGSWKNSPNRLSLSSFRFWKEKNKRQARDAPSALGHVWTAPWQELSDVAAALVGCGHVSGLFVRRIWPLALMLCADRLPIESAHFKVR